MTHMLLVGNPNCGKTTLFNALTGEHQSVGNWPGVTVEKKTGRLSIGSAPFTITDLPGVYSLVSSRDSASQDEQITAREVAFSEASLIINVIDACHLERHLYLTSQLLELGKPLIVVLNMMDMAESLGIEIDVEQLSRQLDCPVVAIEAHRHVGLGALKQVMAASSSLLAPAQKQWTWPLVVQNRLALLEERLLLDGHAPRLAFYLACRLLEGDTLLVSPPVMAAASAADMDILMADTRYQTIHEWVLQVQKRSSDASEHRTAKIDRIVLHRWLALPIFFATMYVVFFLAINVGGAFQEFVDITTDAVFVQGSAWLLQQWHASPGWIALLAYGVGKGINTTLTFIPVIFFVFFFLSLLEASGYMARAAFVVDKVMRWLGLPGKSFVPMIVGFGCNVPAIMAARILDSDRDKLLTVVMTPFMSCSARLAIYAVFVAAFFPTGGANVVFSLYLMGIVMAVSTGFLLRRTLLRGDSSPLILELPVYHKPSLSRLLKETLRRLQYFIRRAGRTIIPVCVVLGGLNAWHAHGADASDTLLSVLGQWLTPIFSPMGVSSENWPATVGLLSGMLAKEVVVGSLNTLYSQMGHVTEASVFVFDFGQAWHAASVAFLTHFSWLGMSPVTDITLAPVYGVMSQYFDGQRGAYAYLLFVLLYIPCASTMAAIRQEAHRKWMWFSIVWSLGVAYAIAVLFYQFATIVSHPSQTIAWLLGILCCLFCVVGGLYRISSAIGEHHVVATS